MRSEEEVRRALDSYGDMVWRVCMVHLKNRDDAQDILQNVLLKFAQHTRPFQSPEHEKAWLIVTARNECKNQLKHWWRTHRESEEAMEKLTWEQPVDGELWDAVLTLPQHQRMALYLCYYQGYTAREAAEIMGKNPSTVRTWLAQGRKKLKEVLEVEYHG